MDLETALPPLKSASNRQALAYWESKRNGAAMPRRIELFEIAELLDGVLIVDVLSDPRDFHYRFVGSRIDEFLERPLTGRNVLDVAHQRPPSRLWSAFCQVVDTGVPVAGEVPYVGPKRDFIRMEDVIMPIAADGVTVSTLFIAADFFRASDVDD